MNIQENNIDFYIELENFKKICIRYFINLYKNNNERFQNITTYSFTYNIKITDIEDRYEILFQNLSYQGGDFCLFINNNTLDILYLTFRVTNHWFDVYPEDKNKNKKLNPHTKKIFDFFKESTTLYEKEFLCKKISDF